MYIIPQETQPSVACPGIYKRGRGTERGDYMEILWTDDVLPRGVWRIFLKHTPLRLNHKGSGDKIHTHANVSLSQVVENERMYT